tara:strand:- start:48 stop:293 length:246 start_codon:yes stop_codon:yes gene_type:complete
MSIENVTEIETWVDPFASDLFFNHNLENYNAVDKETATSEEIFEAILKDAEEFVEIVEHHFSGLSINHTPEEYAKNFLERV